MKEPHLLRATAAPDSFAPLAAAMAALGLRLGWLELAAAPPAPLPAGPAAALGLGVLRAVAVGPGLTVAAKPLRGAPVLRDLLREHFLGCRLVLIAGEAAPEELPAIEPDGGEDGGEDGRYRLVAGGGEAARRLTAAALAARLRRPG
ncbi:MAG TPA: hypothetical protein VHM02_08310, partial [Thermoanaerobaculia bacterium]|nr:hypothetical protein [Thermoanaerobaculia bacterium]